VTLKVTRLLASPLEELAPEGESGDIVSSVTSA
jgi:hypothetical protein